MYTKGLPKTRNTLVQELRGIEKIFVALVFFVVWNIFVAEGQVVDVSDVQQRVKSQSEKFHPYPESTVKYQDNLSSPVFSSTLEAQVFQNRCSHNLFLSITRVASRDKTSCVDVVTQPNGPDSLYLFFPEDDSQMTIEDIPFLVIQINAKTLGESLPNYASSTELSQYLIQLSNYLEGIGEQVLSKKYRDLHDTYHFPSVTNTNVSNTQYKFSEIYQAGDPLLAKRIEEDVAKKFEKHLYESILEGGMAMLLQQIRLPNNPKFGSLNTEVVSLGETLNTVRNNGNTNDIIAAEKDFVQKIYKLVKQYENNYAERDLASSPTHILQNSDEMLCLSKTMLVYQIFRKYDMDVEVAEFSKHPVVIVKLSNNREFMVDATQNMQFDWGRSHFGRREKKQVLYMSSADLDVETLLLSELLHNTYNPDTKSPIENIRTLKQAIHINPQNIWAHLSLVQVYLQQGSHDAALATLEEAEVLLEELYSFGVSEHGTEDIVLLIAKLQKKLL